MRNSTSSSIAVNVNMSWSESSLSIDQFMHTYEGAFDITNLKQVEHIGNYASFHIIVGSNVATVYYYETHNKWYVKF